jgi:hypothetical protein
VEYNYLFNLIERNAYSHVLLNYLHKQEIEIPKPPITLLLILNYLFRLRLLKTLESILKYIMQLKSSQVSKNYQLARNRGIALAKKELKCDLLL